MTIEEVIALLSLCLACIGLGYKIGRDIKDTKK